ncbi:MAG: hypothetical protein JWM10_3708 [Myxococcaceae bacterium]|nr:hypothetical protein [Myxococcaceae bacterium]
MADITRAELYALGLRSAALGNVSTADQDAEIETTTAICRAYVRGRYQGAQLAAAVVDPAYKGAVAKVCTHRLLSTRGYDPSKGVDEGAMNNHDAMLRFLRDVQAGNAHLDVPETEADTFSAALGSSGLFGPSFSDDPRDC